MGCAKCSLGQVITHDRPPEAHPVILQLWAHLAVREWCQCAATSKMHMSTVTPGAMLSIVQLPEQRVLSMCLGSIVGYSIARQRLGQLICNLTAKFATCFYNESPSSCCNAFDQGSLRLTR